MAATYRLPFPNPNLADGFGSLKYLDGGRWVKRVRPHQGVDFPQAHGTPIPAIADGTVADVYHSGELGWITVLKHTRTTWERVVMKWRPVYSFSCHQSDRPALTIGASVKVGQTIGHVGVQGRNGTAAAGEHLHLAMSHDVKGGYSGRVFDPIKFIRARLGKAMDKPVKAGKGKTHTVVADENLSLIANRYRTTVDKLVQLNGIKNPNLIHPGQVLQLP